MHLFLRVSVFSKMYGIRYVFGEGRDSFTPIDESFHLELDGFGPEISHVKFMCFGLSEGGSKSNNIMHESSSFLGCCVDVAVNRGLMVGVASRS